MTLPIFTHPDMTGHQPGVGHPERPERLAAVLAALADAGLDGDRRAATEASVEDLERLHPAAYVANILNASPEAGRVSLDADTHLSPGSVRAARVSLRAP